MSLTKSPLGPVIGAEIEGLDLRQPLGKETRDEILNEFHEHVLLLFRGQDLTEDQQTRFATTFGELSKPDPLEGWADVRQQVIARTAVVLGNAPTDAVDTSERAIAKTSSPAVVMTKCTGSLRP